MKKKSEALALQRNKETNRVAFLFLIPVAVLLILYIFYPIIDAFRISTLKWNGISPNTTFIGLDNWIKLIHDPHFWSAFKNNIIVMILSICVQIPLGLAMATFVEYAGKKSKLFKIVWFIPMLMSSVAIGFLFQYALATNGGIISSVSSLFGGGNIDLLGNPDTALFTVIGVIAWQFTPFYMVYCVAAYTNISTDLYEAAQLDGVNKRTYFAHIALPLLAPSLKSAAILSMVGSLKYFDLIYVMTGGGPGTSTELMSTYMYKMSFAKFNMGYGSTIASGMFLVITIISLLTMRLLNGKGEEK
ncbi:MAG: sugar ABC transporter permease [Clostridiales Family XIII bacterium]|jgi:raffinose/stachyose/melibiose transport system permease protein|nr:sugar ABC transporter permease [Clostridiales Family XIII bacterium]